MSITRFQTGFTRAQHASQHVQNVMSMVLCKMLGRMRIRILSGIMDSFRYLKRALMLWTTISKHMRRDPSEKGEDDDTYEEDEEYKGVA
eukprot:8343040-Pyramimonas_sp.AAC.1